MRHILAASALTLAACSTVDDHAGRDWNNDPARALAAAYQRDMTRMLVGRGVGDALDALRADGYECDTGEAHERHPDPMSVCRKSFATRACQLDWETALYPKKGVVRSVEGVFTRDCVGVNRDWPAPNRSAIDDGLAAPLTAPKM
jgi:hypothetical protein